MRESQLVDRQTGAHAAERVQEDRHRRGVDRTGLRVGPRGAGEDLIGGAAKRGRIEFRLADSARLDHVELGCGEHPRGGRPGRRIDLEQRQVAICLDQQRTVQGRRGGKGEPGGGTTDYAVDIFYEALKNKKYTCFLSENTYLPMMYMDDAIRATIELMQAPAEQMKLRMSYNLSAMSFSPKEIAEEVKKLIPEFSIDYSPDHRQAIADGWPKSIDDAPARADWGWKHEYDLPKMTAVMLENLKRKLSL